MIAPTINGSLDPLSGARKTPVACMRLGLRLAFRDFEQEMSQSVGVSTNQLDFFVGQAMIEAVSHLDDSVSNRYQVGVHVSHADAPWLIGISDLSVDGLVNFSLKGPQASTSES